MMNMVRYFVSSICFLLAIQTNAITKSELIKQVAKKSKTVNFCISANFASKISFNNNSICDSGTFYFSPPNKTKAEFKVSEMVVSSYGDTSWTKSSNGDITRSVTAQNGLPGSQGGKNTFSSPDLLSFLKNQEFEISRQDTALIVINLNIASGTEKVPLSLYIDAKTYLIMRMEFYVPGVGSFQTGYKYTKFGEYFVVQEINTVMGSIGFSRIKIDEYKKCNKKDSFFRLF